MEVLVATLDAPAKLTVIGSLKSSFRNFGRSSLQLVSGLIVCTVAGFASALVSPPGGVLAGRPRLTWLGVANPLPLPCGLRDTCPVAIGMLDIAFGVWLTAGSGTAVVGVIDVPAWADIFSRLSDSMLDVLDDVGYRLDLFRITGDSLNLSPKTQTHIARVTTHWLSV